MAKETKKKTEKSTGSAQTSNVVRTIGTRGRTFEGFVTKKFHKRVVIEFERTVFIQKYERFDKKKTRIHARLPDSMEKDIQIGDLIQVQECRPLSKIIHFVVIKKIRSATEDKKQ